MSGHTENSVDIEADLDTVWRITNDLECWPALFTEYSALEILEHHDSTWRFRLTMHPDANGNAWSWVSERTLDEAQHRVTARRIDPGWFEYMHIVWTYFAHGTKTRMVWSQDFSMRADSPFDDAEMTKRINFNTVVQMAHIRKEVERLSVLQVQPIGRHFAPAETS